MQLATEFRSKRRPPVGWRLSVDRAWRTPELRRAFELETGVAPLATDRLDRTVQRGEGQTETYHDRFILWATRHLGLEAQAPPAVRIRLETFR